MNGLNTSGDLGNYFRKTAAYELERFEPTSAAPGNVAAAMENGPITAEPEWPEIVPPLGRAPIPTAVPGTEMS